MHPAVIAAIVAGVILIVIAMACMRAAGAADDGMDFERDLPPEPLRLRDRERSADID
jgi:hypothetical protein